MEDYSGYETVKERLILAGISELQKHSVEDLSLRKLSALCNVSCAAPYKHFKNKQEFMSEVIHYINCQWTKLRSQVMEAYADDTKAQMIEVCIAYIKFCMANPNFRNIIVMKPAGSLSDTESWQAEENFYFSQNDNLIRKYCTERFRDRELIEKKVFLIHSAVYGTIYMIDQEHLRNSEETIGMVRAVLEDELE